MRLYTHNFRVLQGVEAGYDGFYEREKTKPPHQSLPRLRAAIHMAQKMGEGLGRG